MDRKGFFSAASRVAILILGLAAFLLLGPAPAGAFPTSMVATPVPGGGGSHGVAVDGNGIVWYVPVGATLTRQDPSFAPGDPAGITVIALPHPAVNLAIDNQDKIWISCSDGFVTKYDPGLNTFTNYGPVGPCGFLDHIHFHSDGMIYTTCLDAHYIIRLDPGTGTITTFPVPTPGSATAGITGDFTGKLWTIERSAHKVVEADPALIVANTSAGITEYPIPNSPYSPETVKGCGNQIWFTGLSSGPNGPRVSYIDITTKLITQIDVHPGQGGATYGLAVDGNGNPFLTNPFSPFVYGVDASSNTPHVYPTPSIPHHIAISPTTGHLWYSYFGNGVVRLVPDEPLQPTCEPTEPPGMNCPRTSGFWAQQCGQQDNGSTKFTLAEMTQIAEKVDDLSSFFDWAAGTDLDRFCARIDPPSPMTQRRQALSQYAVMLANVATGQLGLVAANGDQISLSTSTPIACVGFSATTIGELIAEIDAALLAIGGAAASSDDVGDPEENESDVWQADAGIATAPNPLYTDMITCLDAINNGIGIGETCPESDLEVAVLPGRDGVSMASRPITAEAIGFSRPTPNPFSGSTSLSYRVSGAGEQVRLAVYDLAGRKVRTLVGAFQPSGDHTVSWDGRGDDGLRVRPGMYFVRGAIGRQPMVSRVTYVQ